MYNFSIWQYTCTCSDIFNERMLPFLIYKVCHLLENLTHHAEDKKDTM